MSKRAPAGTVTIAAIQPAARRATPCARPLCGMRVAAGFPSPADDYMEGALDLNDYLVRNPPATFFFRVTGESMREAGILPNDLLVVDRSIEPRNGQVVIAVLDGELTVKRLCRRNGIWELHAANPEFAPIRIDNGRQLDIWGVVRYAIHPISGS